LNDNALVIENGGNPFLSVDATPASEQASIGAFNSTSDGASLTINAGLPANASFSVNGLGSVFWPTGFNPGGALYLSNTIASGVTYSVTDTDLIIYRDVSTAAIELPAAGAFQGRILIIKNKETGTTVDLVPDGTDKIEGVNANYTIPVLGNVILSCITGEGWVIG
jgi:hypothetical protein